MSRKIVLSKRAARNLGKLLEYLELKWSIRVRSNFIEKLEKALDILKDNPESSPESEIIAGLRKNVITKQTTIYYKFDNSKIYIVAVFDTRQDVSRLKEEDR